MHLYFVLPYAIERHLKTCFPGWPSPPCLSPLQYVVHSGLLQSEHTIRKCKKMAGQNTFEILLLNDANMIGEH